MKQNAIALGLACLCAVGCGDDDVSLDGGTDGGVMDAPAPMDGGMDAGDDAGTFDAAPADAGDDAGPPDECEGGVALTCIDETRRRVCVEEEGRWVIGEEDCAAETACLFGSCATEVQQQTADQIRSYIGEVRGRSGHPFEEDYAALEEEALRVMLAYEDPQEGLVRGAIRFARSYQHGHQALQFGEDSGLCGGEDAYAYQAQTFYGGLCGAPVGDEILVMSAPDGNALGLRPGDVIVATDAWEAGENFLDEVAAAPVCMSRIGASEASDRSEAAASFFGKIDEGTVLTVRGTDGTMRTVNVPARETDIEAGQDFCLNPFGGYEFVEAALTMRDDGVAVIRNSTLRPRGPWPDAETYLREVQNMLDRIGAVLEMVPDGAPIIWDIRGNSGGAAEVALGIVAGMPGARSAELSRGYVRVVDSDPPAWGEDPHPFQSHSMEIADDLVTNHRDHDVAVLVNGQTVSAAEFFAYAAKEFSDALIVGPEGTAGSFGFGGMAFRTVEGPVIPIQHRVDPFRVETPEGEFLERASVTPDMVVAYDPSDVADGVDTVLEAAAAALLAR